MKTPPKPLEPQFGPIDQGMILLVHTDSPPAEDVQTTWRHLRLVNRAVRQYQKDLDFCRVGCPVTQERNLVFQSPAQGVIELCYCTLDIRVLSPGLAQAECDGFFALARPHTRHK